MDLGQSKSIHGLAIGFVSCEYGLIISDLEMGDALAQHLNRVTQGRAGNTLISLLISMGISGIMMVGMMAFFTNQMRAQKQLAQKI